MSRAALVFAALASAASIALAGAPDLPDLPAPLLEDLRQIVSEGRVAGGAVVLVDANGPTAAHWFGVADRERDIAVGPATCFRAGSVSKLAAALLAHRLAAEQAVMLDAPMPTHLQPPMPPGCTQPPTLAQLLEHTGGVAGSSHTDYGAQQPDASVADVAGRIARTPLRWCAGRHYSYSNNGTTLAAAALEAATGQDFDALMQQRLFAPLAMRDASFATAAWPACLSRSYAADGHTPVSAWQLPVRPAGALIATPLDLARLVQHLLRNPPLAQSMSRASTSLAARAGATDVYAQGLFKFMAAGGLLTGHWGRIDGFQTAVGFDPQLGTGLVIAVNTAERRTMGRLRERVAAHLRASAPAAPPPAAARPRAGIDGWYANRTHDMPLRAPWVALFDVVRIRTTEHGLELRGLWLGAAPRVVIATGPTSFRDPALRVATMAFAEADGTHWWIDNESYARVAPLATVARLTVALAGLAAVAVIPPGVALLGALWLWRGRPRRTAARAVWPWLLASALAWWTVLGGYAATGLFGVGDSLGALGRPSALSLLLMTASVLAPAATAASLWQQRGALRPVALAFGTVLMLFASLVWQLGWIPLITFRP
jgi:CubicO group peptidase (beta-lactamase class C family)